MARRIGARAAWPVRHVARLGLNRASAAHTKRCAGDTYIYQYAESLLTTPPSWADMHRPRHNLPRLTRSPLLGKKLTIPGVHTGFVGDFQPLGNHLQAPCVFGRTRMINRLDDFPDHARQGRRAVLRNHTRKRIDDRPCLSVITDP